MTDHLALVTALSSGAAHLSLKARIQTEWIDLVLFGTANWIDSPESTLLVKALFHLFSDKHSFGITPDPAHMLTLVTKSVEFLIQQQRQFMSSQNEIPSAPPTSRILPTRSRPDSPSQGITPLRSMAIVLFENAVFCPDLHDSLLNLLTPLSQDSSNLNSRRLAIVCLGNMCAKSGAKFIPLLRHASAALIAIVVKHSVVPSQILAQSLRSLYMIVNENKTISGEIVNQLVAILPLLIFPTLSEFAAWKAIGTKSDSWRKPPDSDSEISDTDTTGPRKFHQSNTKLWMNALQLLSAFTKSNPKQVFPQFGSIIFPGGNLASIPLIDIIIFSPDPKLRTAATSTICTLFESLKPFFAIASHSETKPASFASLSQRLADQLCAFHISLMTHILDKQHASTLTLLLQVLTSLVQCTLYTRLSQDFRSEIVTRIGALVSHHDSSVQARALECYSAVLSTIQEPNTCATSLTWIDTIPGVLQKCCDYASSDQIVLRIAALEGCCAIARYHPLSFSQQWDSILVDVLDKARMNTDTATRLAAAKILEQFANSCSTGALCAENVPTQWWIYISTIVTDSFIFDRMFAIRAMGLNIIGQIPFVELGILNAELCTLCWKGAEQLVADDHSDVRSAAWGAIGVLIGQVILTQNISCLQRIADLIVTVSINESNVATKVRAAWALGNLTEMWQKLAESYKSETSSLTKMTCEQIVLLLKTANSFTGDNEKCRANGVRAIGNVVKLALTDPLLTSPTFSSLLSESTRLSIKASQGGSFKARWSACYTLSIILLLPDTAGTHQRQRADIFTVLAKAATTCTNFKVKISAITAMQSANASDNVVHTLFDSPTQSTSVNINSLIKNNIDICLDAIQSTLDMMDENVNEAKFGEFRYTDQLKQAAKATTQHLLHLQK
ncbi:hypothetical protein BDV3_004335 [Batrachochytrium dendrobatidis]